MKAAVNKLIPFSSVDGPGNRTAVFLQGCNFNCRYCHNPETRALCQNCGECVSHCPAGALSLEDLSTKSPESVLVKGGILAKEEAQAASIRRKPRVLFDPSRCVSCDSCIKTCRHNASPRIRWMNAEEVYREIQKNVPFIRGVTVSGGECTLYPEFLKELGDLCKKGGLGFLLDSNGTYDFSEDPDQLLPSIDGVMLDVKAWTKEDHRRVTYASNDMVLKNLKFLSEAAMLEEVRTVVVPGLFDAEKTIRETVKTIKPYLGRRKITYKIIAYREMGVREEYKNFRSPGKDELKALSNIAMEEGMKNIIII